MPCDDGAVRSQVLRREGSESFRMSTPGRDADSWVSVWAQWVTTSAAGRWAGQVDLDNGGVRELAMAIVTMRDWGRWWGGGQ